MTGSQETSIPFAPGSVSVGLYAHGDGAIHQVEDLLAQARVAAEAGFSGITISEHHAGFRRYVPVPVLVAGWMLAENPRLWAAPCPILLPLRSPGLVAEEVAWMAARFPRRVGVGFAPGYAPADFEIAEADVVRRNRTFAKQLPAVVAALSGGATGPLASDPAIRHLAAEPVPIVASAAGPIGARRAAEAGAGLILGAFNPAEQVRELFEVFRAAGGRGPRLLIRRAWLGVLPANTMARLSMEYQGAGATWHPVGEQEDMLVFSEDPDQLADRLAEVVTSTGADALNLRFTVPEEGADVIREQIADFGSRALPRLRAQLEQAVTNS